MRNRRGLVPIQVIRYSARNAIADFRASYTWRSWVIGWLGRMFAQVTFFTTIAVALGAQASVQYLVLGNAVMVCAIDAMAVVASSARERREGTLPLLAAAPGQTIWVFFGRSLQWPVSGTMAALITLLGLSPAFGVSWPVVDIPVLVALLALTGMSTYCVGLCLSAVVLTASNARNIVSNVAYLLMMAVCGVQVPVSFWPGWVQVFAQMLPLTHTLAAIRSVAAHADAISVGVQAISGAAAGLGWFVTATAAFTLIETRARRLGALDAE